MGRGDTEWYTRTYRCRNGVVEKTKYPVCISGGKQNRRERRRAAKKASRAGDNAARQAARLLNNNFFTGISDHLLLSYSESGYKKLLKRADRLMPDLPERDRIFIAAQKELENFVRRVQYETKGVKYFAITSDMDGESREPVRIHHHIIIERECLEVCKKKWEKLGFALEKELYSINGDLTPLASYLINQVRYIPDNKRYTRSRNLEEPEMTEPLEVTRYAENEISLPAGAILLYRSPYSRGASQYVRYLMRDRKRMSGPGACTVNIESRLQC